MKRLIVTALVTAAMVFSVVAVLSRIPYGTNVLNFAFGKKIY